MGSSVVPKRNQVQQHFVKNAASEMVQIMLPDVIGIPVPGVESVACFVLLSAVGVTQTTHVGPESTQRSAATV